MTEKRWNRIDAILDKALTLESEERTKYISTQCSGDTALQSEITAFLHSIEASGPFWEELLISNRVLFKDLTGELSSLQNPVPKDANIIIDSYRLIKRIGRGGMGDIYCAERADGQYRQRVAVKIVRRGLDIPDQIRRFQQERQILATLDHPNIARLIDGGITADGRPYLVMEFVDGLPVTNFCEIHECTIQERLDLFARICEAVHYAHRNLVVHRDLKPDNILVTKKGNLKVLDFGIAKLLDTELTGQALIETRAGQRLLSLQYAAPEQITMEPVTTSTDAYALGLLLFELLCGCRPFDLKDKTHRESERIILFEEPPKPSSVNSRIPKDLDAITFKALRKEPDRRYESARQLRNDIISYRNSFPVSARKDNVRYRIGKFLRRYAGILMSVFALLLLAIAFALFHTWQLAGQRNLAQSEAQKAEEVTDFLIELFETAKTDEAGNAPDPEDLLRHGKEAVFKKEYERPETRAALLDVLGRTYQRLGNYEEATSLLQQSYKMRIGSATAHESDIAQSLNHLGLLMLDTGKYSEAETNFEQSLHIRDRLYGRLHPKTLNTLSNLAMTAIHLGNFDEAEKHYQNILDISRQLYPEKHLYEATALNSLGFILEHRENFKRAAQYYIQALGLMKSLLGEEHQRVAIIYNNLGRVNSEQGNLKEAESYHRQALSLRRKRLGENHYQVGHSLNNLAFIYRKRHDFITAEELQRQALAVYHKALRAEHPFAGLGLSNLGGILLEQGRLDSAEYYLKNGLAVYRKSLPNHHLRIARVHKDLANIAHRRQNYHRADSLFGLAYDGFTHSLSPIHSEVMELLSIQFENARQSDDFIQAEQLFRHAYEYARSSLEENHPTRIELRNRLADLLRLAGQPEKAMLLFSSLQK